MKEKIIFFIKVFAIAILLISISVALYLILKKDTIIQNYDCYILSIFWTSTSCTTKNSKNYECFELVKKLGDDKYFTLHGLWPSLLSGEIPKGCNEGKNITPNFDDDKSFKEKLDKYWPGLYSNNSYLWMNEYNKHGYCYMKRNHLNVIDDYKKYFELTVDIFENGYRDLMEQILPDSKGVYNISKAKFKYLLNSTKVKLNLNNTSTYSLICDEKTNQLSEIRFVYDLNFQRTSQEKSQEDCGDFFTLNFTDETKVPVYDKYDIYIFTIMYSPTTCKFKGQYCYDLIKTKQHNKFIIHGLWPSYKNGIIPQMCNIGEDIEINDDESEYFNNVKEYWYTLYTNGNDYFWTHEYNTHGYCYNIRKGENIDNYKFYIDKVLSIYNNNNFSGLFDYIYGDFLKKEQKTNKTYLLTKLGEKYSNNAFYISCKNIDNKMYLDEIRFKLDLNFNFTSDGNMSDECPEIFMIEIMDKPKDTHEDDDDPSFFNKYDIYVFSILWQATSCKEIGYNCYNIIEDIPKNVWIIHGLWPNYKNGTLPKWCNGKNDIDIKISNKTLYNIMKDYWPGLYSSDERFWGNEYNKHGYCYNKRNNIDVQNYEKYFSKSVDIYEKYDFKNIFINFCGDKMIGDVKINRTELENYFEKNKIEKGTYLLLCQTYEINNLNISYISEIRFNFDLDFNLYKNESQTHIEDCPSEFMVEFI